MIYRLLYFDKIYLYAKKLRTIKIPTSVKTFHPIFNEVGYSIIEASNDEIIPVSQLSDNNQKIIIFDDYVCEKNQSKLIDYFIRGRDIKTVV